MITVAKPYKKEVFKNSGRKKVAKSKVVVMEWLQYTI